MSDFPNGLTVTGTLSVAGSEVPTLTSTSTLTNKTLTAPVLANPSYSGATANGGTVTTIDINGGTIDGTVIGGSAPAAVSATTLSTTGNIIAGDGTAATTSVVNGTASGSGGGAFVGVKNGGWNIAILGNKSAMLGGTYDSTATLYSAGPIDIYGSATKVATVSSTGISVTGALSTSGAIVGSTTVQGLSVRGVSADGVGYPLAVQGTTKGVRVSTSSTTSSIEGVDNTLSASYQPLAIGGSTLALTSSGTTVATVSSTGLAVTGALSATGNVSTSAGTVTGLTTTATNGTISVSSTNDTTNGVVGTFSNHPLAFYVNSSKQATLDTSGNLGLGVTPSAWDASIKALEVNGASLGAQSAATWVLNNAYVASGGGAKYKNTGVAGRILLDANGISFSAAPSGTAGNAITFTQAMTLDASSHLTVAGGITTGSYTVATRPAHAAGRIIHVTDGGAGAVFQGSAGGAWVNLG